RPAVRGGPRPGRVPLLPAQRGLRPHPLPALRLRAYRDARVGGEAGAPARAPAPEGGRRMIPAALLRRIPRLGDWKEACPAGAPVRDSDCAGLDCDTLRLTALREG